MRIELRPDGETYAVDRELEAGSYFAEMKDAPLLAVVALSGGRHPVSNDPLVGFVS